MQKYRTEAISIARATGGGKRPSLAVVLAYLACAIIWGTTWFAIRVCIEPGGFPIYAGAAWRFVISATCLIVIWWALRKRLHGGALNFKAWIFLAGGLSGIAYGFLYGAEKEISGGLAAVLSATTPLITAMFAMLTKTERPSKSALFGSCLAFIGVATIFRERLMVSQAQAFAVQIMMVVCLLNAFANVFMKKYGNKIDAIPSNAVFFGAAALVLSLTSWLRDTQPMPMPLPLWPSLALLYLALVGTLVAFVCFFYLLKHVRLSTAMTLSFVTPVIALVIDAIWEKQAIISAETYLGIAIILVGVAASVFLRSQPKV